MHLQQTKSRSRRTGGPQYYFHNIPDPVKEFLRNRGACPVVLQTPYGIANSSFMAVDRDHKLRAGGKMVKGRVGHDRIQGAESIAEAIRRWYGLKRQINAACEESPDGVSWAGKQIERVVSDHKKTDTQYIHEADLLRVASALSLLGLDLGLYLTKGYDCPHSQFSFRDLPPYPCPVEIKKRSSRFDYQITRYPHLPRAVVLCLDHDLVNPPDHVDVLELSTLADYLRN